MTSCRAARSRCEVISFFLRCEKGRKRNICHDYVFPLRISKIISKNSMEKFAEREKKCRKEIRKIISKREDEQNSSRFSRKKEKRLKRVGKKKKKGKSL